GRPRRTSRSSAVRGREYQGTGRSGAGQGLGTVTDTATLTSPGQNLNTRCRDDVPALTSGCQPPPPGPPAARGRRAGGPGVERGQGDMGAVLLTSLPTTSPGS